MTDEEAQAFADAIVYAHSTVKACRICQNLTDSEVVRYAVMTDVTKGLFALLKHLRMFRRLRGQMSTREYIMLCMGLFRLLTE